MRNRSFLAVKRGNMLTELQTQSKLIGFKQSAKAVESGKVKKVFLAKDADEKLIAPLKKACEKKEIEFEYAETMLELGRACGINIGAAVAVILRD